MSAIISRSTIGASRITARKLSVCDKFHKVIKDFVAFCKVNMCDVFGDFFGCLILISARTFAHYCGLFLAGL
jgi:hypothetical protein